MDPNERREDQKLAARTRRRSLRIELIHAEPHVPAHLNSSFDSGRPISPTAHEADEDDHEHALDSSVDFHVRDTHAATSPPEEDDDLFADM